MAIGRPTNNITFNKVTRVSSITNGSFARKFFSLNNADKISNKNSIRNDDSILKSGLALNSLSLLANASKESSVNLVNQIKDKISNITFDTNKDIKSPFSQLSIDSFKDGIINNLNSTIPSNINGLLKNNTNLMANELVKNKINSFVKSHNDQSNIVTNITVPEIDSITVDIDKNRGSVDSFYTHIIFSLKLDQLSTKKIKGVRIFRTEVGKLQLPLLSNIGIEKIKSNKLMSRIKNPEFASGQILDSLSRNGIKNSISEINPIDNILNLRISKTIENFNIGQINEKFGISNLNVNKNLNSFIGNDLKIDESVSQDLNYLRRLQQNTNNNEINSGKINVGRSNILSSRLGAEQIRQLDNKNDSNDLFVVDEDNKQLFKEIAFIRPMLPTSVSNAKNGKIIGDHVEFSYDDESVSYGKIYQYYIVAVDNNGKESLRSRIVEISINGTRVPEAPRRVLAQLNETFISLLISVKDQLVEKFEIYRKEIDSNIDEISRINVLSGQSGFISKIEYKRKLETGFINVGESVNIGKDGGGSFIDFSVRTGRTYIYRVYSVDVFGNKSETPEEITIVLPDPKNFSGLKKPIILAEVDSKTNKIKLTFEANDEKVIALYLSRRDLTIGELSFTTPGQSSAIKLGSQRNSFGRSNMEDIKLRGDKEGIWNGIFTNDRKRHIFLDQTVQLDHYYQYKLFGVDRFGNKSSYEISNKILASSRPLINAPLNLSNQLLYDDNGILKSLKLTWDDGNIDISAEDRLGNREVLQNSSVRTLYEVQRKKQGEEVWNSFPITENKELIDQLKFTSEVPKYLPQPLERGATYAYRIKALQTGSFISNFSPAIEVFIDAPVLPPIAMKLTTPDTKTKPFFIAVNWNSSPSSGIIDRWVLERAEANNFASDKLNSLNISEFGKLQFKQFRTIYRESSRGKSSDLNDNVESNKLERGHEKLLIGQHYFIDQNISFGNSYFYRIKSVSISGQESSWIYKGIRISDETFEQKQNLVINSDEKKTLSNNLLPMELKNSILSAPIETLNSSLSLLPDFSKPSLPTTSLDLTKLNLVSEPVLNLSPTLLNNTLTNTDLNLSTLDSTKILSSITTSPLNTLTNTSLITTSPLTTTTLNTTNLSTLDATKIIYPTTTSPLKTTTTFYTTTSKLLVGSTLTTSTKLLTGLK